VKSKRRPGGIGFAFHRAGSNSGLFQGFCFLKSAKNDLKMRCQNVKLFLREPLVNFVCHTRQFGHLKRMRLVLDEITGNIKTRGFPVPSHGGSANPWPRPG